MENRADLRSSSDCIATDRDSGVCKLASDHTEAVSYCEDSNKHGCNTCLHHQSSASKPNHNEMSKPTDRRPSTQTNENNTQKVNSTDVLDNICPVHEDEVLKFFCPRHGCFGCGECMLIEHRSCKRIKYIKEKSKEIENSPEYIWFTKELETVVLMAECVTRKVEQSSAVASKRCEDIRRNIRHVKEKVTRRLDEMEKELSQEAVKISENNKTKLNDVFKECNDVSREASALLSRLETFKGSEQFSKMFIEMKCERNHVMKMKTTLETCNSEASVATYTFRSKPLTDILQSSDLPGTLELLDPKTANVTFESDITVRTNNDTEICNISEAVTLDGQKVALVDSSNKSVKLLDAQQRVVISELKLSSTNTPYGITQTMNDEMAVTIPKEKKISLVSMANNELSRVEEIMTPNESFWIGSYLDKFIVTVDCPQRIDILDKKGQILQTVSVDKEYQKPFSKMSNITVSRDFSTVYVADQARHTVIAISLWRKKTQTYSSWYLRGPVSMAVDLAGNVYVCGNQTNDIHQTTADCKKIRIPLTKSEGLKKPQALAFCDVTDKLLVGMESSDVLKVFRMSY